MATDRDEVGEVIRSELLAKRRASVAVYERIAALAKETTDMASLVRALEVMAEAEHAERALDAAPRSS